MSRRILILPSSPNSAFPWLSYHIPHLTVPCLPPLLPIPSSPPSPSSPLPQLGASSSLHNSTLSRHKLHTTSDTTSDTTLHSSGTALHSSDLLTSLVKTRLCSLFRT
ncbi:hypothetical protein KC19_12G151700 [Ceratodon purpureus]|uniref:Uncharacterized protein n=1 Tax=Ceratodon purpureus TaxID=3225 RepID=A0A8T0G7A8_CERPU|nr:hypothetical protein KC19_12G151700 [Ceratodon purpureus]